MNLISKTYIYVRDQPFMLKGDYTFIYSFELLNNHL